jgi:8-oxo-dGTP pyrophosphatase MutT (NUDIX family)
VPPLRGLNGDDVARRLDAAARRAPVAIDDRPVNGPVNGSVNGVPPGHETLIPAAVLVPIIAHPQPTVLLTLRGRHLKAHAGQVSFPGGRIEADDAHPEAAALREAAEEIGLAPGAARIVGRLGEHITGTGYSVTPVVALLHPPLTLRPDPAEVDEVFELPLADVLDPATQTFEERVILGRARRFWVVRHERHLIWGATAAMLVALGRALRDDTAA